MKSKTLKEQVQELRRRLDTVSARTTSDDRALQSDVGMLQCRCADLENRVAGLPALFTRVQQLEKALGPVWTTASGHVLPLKLMSDNHLEAALAHVQDRLTARPPWLLEETALIAAFETEIARRAEDDHYHKLAGKVAPRVFVAKLSKWLRWLL